MEKELNLIPFYAEALSFPQNIRRDIDTTYLLHKEEYYQCAKNSEFYDCAFAKDKSLLTEEYYKKSLGFLVYVEKMQDDETAECIFKLFKKAYRKTYLFFKDKDPEEIDMEDYIRYMSSYLTQLDDDSFNGHTMAAIFFSGGHCKNMQTLWEVLDLRWRYVNGFKRISSSNVTPEMDVECKKLEKEIAANIFDKILLSNEETTGFDFIYDLEGLSSLSLFRELEFKRSDIKELVLSYLAADEIKKQNLSFNAYLLPAMHLKGMCKAYNKVKEMYFQNNKETMYVEVSALKKDLLRARSDLKMQENRNEQLLISKMKRWKVY